MLTYSSFILRERIASEFWFLGVFGMFSFLRRLPVGTCFLIGKRKRHFLHTISFFITQNLSFLPTLTHKFISPQLLGWRKYFSVHNFSTFGS